MKIKARIDRLVDSQKIKAIASVSFDGQFVVRNLRVVDGNKGLFVAYPQESYTDKDGTKKYSNVFFPISNAGKSEVEQAVLTAYRQALDPSVRKVEREQSQYGESPFGQGPYDYLALGQYPTYPQDFAPISEYESGLLPFEM